MAAVKDRPAATHTGTESYQFNGKLVELKINGLKAAHAVCSAGAFETSRDRCVRPSQKRKLLNIAAQVCSATSTITTDIISMISSLLNDYIALGDDSSRWPH